MLRKAGYSFMPHDPLTSLVDIRDCAVRILHYLDGLSSQEFKQNGLVRDAVERRYIIIGEAINRLRDAAPQFVDRIEDQAAIRKFRNLIVHHYQVIDADYMYTISLEDVPVLLEQVQGLIDSFPDLPE